MLALTGLGLGQVGCKHQLMQEPADAPELRRTNIPVGLEERPHEPIVPPTSSVGIDPATVLDVKRQTKPITLKEMLALAVEQGNTGGQGGSGQDNFGLPQFSGRGISNTDTMKAFVLDPALAAAEVERSISKFDARWITSMTWNKQDQATINFQQSFTNGDTAAFSTTLAKPLPTGGVSGITFSTNYSKLATPPSNQSTFFALPVSYNPRLQFVFEQPLLQGFGVEANQLISSHPGSLLIQGFRSTGAGTEGILIARLRSEQSRTQFDVNLNQLLLNIEIAYWNLYSSYYNLYAQEEGFKEAFRAYNFTLPRVREGVDAPSLKPQLEVQLWQFYDQVVQARGQVLEADRVLRGLLGMKSDDGTVFVPADRPSRTPYSFDFRQAYDEGLKTRPEVILARQELKARQLDLRAQKIGRQPDLRIFSSYDLNGVGSNLTGEENGAFSSMASNQFNSWQIGLRLDMPLGFRDANALVRQGQLNLWRAWYTLSDSERKLFEQIVQAKRQMDQAYLQMEANKRAKEASQRQTNLLNERIVGGLFSSADYLALIQLQQNLARATANEFRFVADYNAALARLEFAKGTIQQYNNIGVIEGALPSFVQTRATDHFRARNAAIKLREHPADAATGQLAGFEFAPVAEMIQQLPGGSPTTLPPGVGMPSAGPGQTPSTPSDPNQPKVSATPATGTVKPYDAWKTTGVPGSTPSQLPPIPGGVQPSGDLGAATTFTQYGSVALPKRSAETPKPGVPVNNAPGK